MKEIPCGCDWSVYDKWNIKNESSANLRMACAQSKCPLDIAMFVFIYLLYAYNTRQLVRVAVA